MKKIEAVMSPYILEEMRDALVGGGVDGMVVSEVSGVPQHGGALRYRGVEYRADQTPKIKVEIVVSDERFPQIIDVVQRHLSADRSDAQLSVLPVEHAVRIRTGERGAHAIDRVASPAPSRAA